MTRTEDSFKHSRVLQYLEDSLPRPMLEFPNTNSSRSGDNAVGAECAFEDGHSFECNATSILLSTPDTDEIWCVSVVHNPYPIC